MYNHTVVLSELNSQQTETNNYIFIAKTCLHIIMAEGLAVQPSSGICTQKYTNENKRIPF
jgi:hypothetical protein